jgi:hypothetical protein
MSHAPPYPDVPSIDLKTSSQIENWATKVAAVNPRSPRISQAILLRQITEFLKFRAGMNHDPVAKRLIGVKSKHSGGLNAN